MTDDNEFIEMPGNYIWWADEPEDDGYREWSETIEKQNQEQQDFIMAEFDTWEAFEQALLNPTSELRKKLRENGLA